LAFCIPDEEEKQNPCSFLIQKLKTYSISPHLQVSSDEKGVKTG